MRLVPPLMNRDFVTQRCWLDQGKEKIILNHSVNHAVCLFFISSVNRIIVLSFAFLFMHDFTNKSVISGMILFLLF